MRTIFCKHARRLLWVVLVQLAAMLSANTFAYASETGKTAIERGRELFAACQVCHALGPDAAHGIGPHLNDILERPIAGIIGYNFSDALRKSAGEGRNWDIATLNGWLESPATFAPGSRMGMSVSDPADRAALIALLTLASEDVEPLASIGEDPEIPAAVLALKGDSEYGEYLASECVTCHQSDGSDKGIPSITGWPEKKFVVVLHAYKSKSRSNEVMQNVATALSDEEIASLATWFATQK